MAPSGSDNLLPIGNGKEAVSQPPNNTKRSRRVKAKANTVSSPVDADVSATASRRSSRSRKQISSPGDVSSPPVVRKGKGWVVVAERIPEDEQPSKRRRRQ
ncbi:hypothetical protein Moror_1641 [Moniliophthora roreri MCA 2997]|uniref:Uncharacterized protein n=1 Tax=Moniliophthora roreri (strain MCA 2997) TaxID=1381753 RepID=V2XIH0_MONRO|nr:hypothetical protein Moror_1641 [Moniliophthora roreri MCA 2997]